MNIEKEPKNEIIARDIVKAAKGIKFGYIQLIIHDSKIVQIDKTEKIRLDRGMINKGGSV